MLTKEQKAMHDNGIGGSEAAIAIGLSPYKTPVDLFMEKVHGTPMYDDETMPDYLHFGSLLEELIANEYCRRKGVRVRKVHKALVNPELKWMFAHVDRQILKEDAILECKSAGHYAKHEWGETGSDKYPEPYRIQVHHQMLCRSRPGAELAVLIGGNDFRSYPVEFDPELAELIIEEETRFWECVTTKTPPKPRTLNDLSLLYPHDLAPQLLTTPEITADCATLMNIKNMMKVMEGDAETILMRVKEYMGDNAILINEQAQALATWKNNKDGTKFDAKGFREENPELYKQYEVEKAGVRVFNLKTLKEAK